MNKFGGVLILMCSMFFLGHAGFALAANDFIINAPTDFSLLTADSSVPATLTTSSSGQVTSIDAGASTLDITLESASTITLSTPISGQFIRVTFLSGSLDYTVNPVCPSTTVTLSGTGASVVFRIQVFEVNNCSGGGTGGGGGGGSGGGSGGSGNSPSNTPYVPAPIVPPAPSADQTTRLDHLNSIGVAVHSLIKLTDDGNPVTEDDSTVYYIGADGYRHVFPNDKVYFTWYCDFSGVQVLSPQDLASIPLGRNITYRPGLKMVKFVNSPIVYVVGPDRTLIPLSSESVAVALYGSDWNKKVDDVSDALFADYKFGPPLNDPSLFNRLEMINSVSTPSSVLSIDGYVDNAGSFICKIMGLSKSAIDGFPPTFRFTNDLYVNSTDSVGIRYLQLFLRYLGPSIYPSGLVTGNFASATEAAVKTFQSVHVISPTGVVSVTTRGVINKILDSLFLLK